MGLPFFGVPTRALLMIQPPLLTFRHRAEKSVCFVDSLCWLRDFKVRLPAHTCTPFALQIAGRARWSGARLILRRSNMVFADDLRTTGMFSFTRSAVISR